VVLDRISAFLGRLSFYAVSSAGLYITAFIHVYIQHMQGEDFVVKLLIILFGAFSSSWCYYRATKLQRAGEVPGDVSRELASDGLIIAIMAIGVVLL